MARRNLEAASRAQKAFRGLRHLVNAAIVDDGGNEIGPLDKLRLVFYGLAQRGIMAEGRWLCCLSCGSAAMEDAYGEWEEKGSGQPFGFCFFHDQDWDTYLETGELYLAFGACGGSDRAVGILITDALDVFGLDYEWNGNSRRRIRVKLYDGRPKETTWRRSRLFGKVTKE